MTRVHCRTVHCNADPLKKSNDRGGGGTYLEGFIKTEITYTATPREQHPTPPKRNSTFVIATPDSTSTPPPSHVWSRPLQPRERAANSRQTWLDICQRRDVVCV